MGDVALITGASTGIGRHLVEGLAARGMAVAGLARGEERLRESRAATRARRHGEERLRLTRDPARRTDSACRPLPRNTPMPATAAGDGHPLQA